MAGAAPQLRVTSSDVGADEKPQGENLSYSEIQLVKFIASGAFGAVHKALFRGTIVAVKELIDRQVNDEEFWHEVEMMRGLRHPQLCLYMGACRGPDDRLYMITEFLPGGDLSHLIARKPLPPWEERLKVVIDVARGLAYLHGVPVIHRDMKPNNILLDENGHAKVCDFGLSKLAPRRGAKEKGAVGNWAFGAPEMMRNLPYGRPVDVYSFGVILAQLLTGIDPEDEDKFARNSKTFALDPASIVPFVPPDAPPALVSIMLDSIRLNPAERPSFQLITNRLLNSLEMRLASTDVTLLAAAHLRLLTSHKSKVFALTEHGEVHSILGNDAKKISVSTPLHQITSVDGSSILGVDRSRNFVQMEGGGASRVILPSVLSVARSNSTFYIATETAPQLHIWSGDSSLPASLPFTGAVVLTVSCGAGHVVAVVQPDKSPESVRVWGSNERGQLGLGDREARTTPTPLAVGKENFVAAACGASHTLLLSDTGRLYSFGANDHGQLGVGSFTDALVPSLVSALVSSSVVSIDAASSFSAAVMNPSAVYAWGTCELWPEKRSQPALLDAFAKRTVFDVACSETSVYALADAPIRASERLSRLSSRGSMSSPIHDDEARTWWEETFGNAFSTKVPWSDFAPKLEARGTSQAEKTAVWKLKDLLTNATGEVVPESFHRFLCFFPIFSTSLRSAADLLAEPWFRCEAMERAQTDSLLTKKSPGTFFVRLSSRTPGNYVLAVAGEKGAMQVEILQQPKSEVSAILRRKINELLRDSKVTQPLPKEENIAPNPYAQSTEALVTSDKQVHHLP